VQCCRVQYSTVDEIEKSHSKQDHILVDFNPPQRVSCCIGPLHFVVAIFVVVVVVLLLLLLLLLLDEVGYRTVQ
jgi:hypothetical protein